MPSRWIDSRNARLALLAMAFASAICVGMFGARLWIFGQAKHEALIGNLLLAWIPLLFALPVYAHGRKPRHWVTLGFCTLVWFLFYPNAPYLVTDLVHLKTRPPVPRWYDLILIMSFAWTGLSLGYFSLYLMQEVVRRWLGRGVGWAFAIGMLALGAFGVFVGRFWRWNSWEAVTNPLGLAGKAMQKMDGMTPKEMATFCTMFFAFSLLIYITLYAFTHLHGWTERTEERLKPGTAAS